MTSSDLKPFVKQALGALGVALTGRPVLLVALHVLEAVVLHELDSGTLDPIIARAAIDLGEPHDAA